MKIKTGLKNLTKPTISSYRINTFVVLFAVAVLFLGLLIHFIKGHDLHQVIRLFNFQLIAASALLMIIVSFFPPIIVKLTHIAFLLSMSAFNFYLQYDNPYALLFWILLCILMYRYGFLRKHSLLKIILLCIFLIVCIEISLMETGQSGIGIEILLFLFMFLTIVYISFKEELHKILFYEKRAKKLITETKQEKEQLQTLIQAKDQEKEQLQAQIMQQKAQIHNEVQELKRIEEQLEKIIAKEQPCDLERFDLTSREREILELLVTTKRTNKEIAEVLEVKTDTVKKHLHNIYDKIGVDDRHGLIELCRNNYSL